MTTIITPDLVAKEFADLLHNNLSFVKRVNRQYDDTFAKSGAKIGASLRIRKPAMYTVGRGPTVTPQVHTEQVATVRATIQSHIAVDFLTADLTLRLNKFSEQVLEPAAAQLAAIIDWDCMRLAMGISPGNDYTGTAYVPEGATGNVVGAPGTVPASALTWLQAAAVLDEGTAPRDGNRFAVLNPATNAATVNALAGLLNPTGKVSAQYSDGVMSQGLGLEFAMSQSVPLLTAGTHNTAYVTNHSSGITEGQTSITVATGTGTIAQGEVFFINGIFAVNPETKQIIYRPDGMPMPRPFVCRAAYSGGAGNVLLTEPIFTGVSGALQNCSAASGAAGIWHNQAITFVQGASVVGIQNLAFHRDAFVFVTADLEDVSAMGAWGARTVMDGISLRVARQWNAQNDRVTCRFDVLAGFATVRPEYACRVLG